MKCHFCDKKVSKKTEDSLRKLEVLISKDLKSNLVESVIVELCNNCILKIKGGK
jgi:hypothetical protein